MIASSDLALTHGHTAESAQATGHGCTDFDYAAIERSISGAEPDEAHPSACDPQLLEGFRAALGVLVDVIIPPGGPLPAPATMGVRLIALLQLVRPEALDGKSMNAIAQEAGVTRAALSKVLVGYSDTFAFWARHQRSLKSRKTYRDVQVTLRVRARGLRAATAARRAGLDAVAV